MSTFLDRLLGREPARKAVYGGPALVAYQTSVPLSAMGTDWQSRAAQYLAAYTVGWFYKAGSRISGDIADLSWVLAYEDVEGDNEEEIVAAPMGLPFDRLSPVEQFLRLAERPNEWQTGRAFRAQQQIRLDFTGRALVYLEGGSGGGLPTGLYGVNPSRMWLSRDKAGVPIGWVLDPHKSGGTPFDLEEIVSVEYPGADESPVGVVEAVYAQVPLTGQIPRHTSDVLSTGGRLAGMAWPKERSLNEDEFADAQRAWRNVASDPNAARRLLLFPEPMEYQVGAASPSEIGIPELASLNRDEVLTAFPINPYMVGVPVAAGLNSGETLRHVRRDYWEGTIHPRTETWEDAFQQQLIPRYESAIGRPLDFDIEEPSLDDAAAIIEKVEALKGLVAVGFDPKAAVSAVALDHIEWVGVPEPPPPEPVDQMPNDQMPNEPGQPPTPQPATQPAPRNTKARREETIGRELPGFADVMRAFLDDQQARLIAEIARVYGTMTKAERKATPDATWWDQGREDRALADALRGLYVRLGRTALQSVAEATQRIVVNRQVANILEAMLTKASGRITGINETTRDAVREVVAEGVRRGYSPLQIADGVPAEGFTGIRQAAAFDEARAELVARTETMLAYNESNLLGYREFGVERVQAIDGDFDEECAARNGQVFTTEEAFGIEDHPNGTLDWEPIVDKAWHRDDRAFDLATKAIEALSVVHPAPVVNVTLPETSQPITVNVPEQAAPVVTVLPAEVTIQPTTVTVEAAQITNILPEQPAPVVNVTTPEVYAPVTVTMPEQRPPVVNVNLPEHKPTTRKVQRDKRGQITGIIEEPTDG